MEGEPEFKKNEELGEEESPKKRYQNLLRRLNQAAWGVRLDESVFAESSDRYGVFKELGELERERQDKQAGGVSPQEIEKLGRLSEKRASILFGGLRKLTADLRKTAKKLSHEEIRQITALENGAGEQFYSLLLRRERAARYLKYSESDLGRLEKAIGPQEAARLKAEVAKETE